MIAVIAAAALAGQAALAVQPAPGAPIDRTDTVPAKQANHKKCCCDDMDKSHDEGMHKGQRGHS